LSPLVGRDKSAAVSGPTGSGGPGSSDDDDEDWPGDDLGPGTGYDDEPTFQPRAGLRPFLGPAPASASPTLAPRVGGSDGFVAKTEPPPPPASRFAGPAAAGSAQAGRTRHLIAVGGGRGGVGKSVLSVNLAVYFAQLGRNVVICDAAPEGSNLHSMLGVPDPPLTTREAEEEGAVTPIATSVPGLRLMPTTYDGLTTTPARPSRRSGWLTRIGDVRADYVILHLGSSSSPATLDLFLAADVSICVTVPEPIAIETTYRFLRALFARALRRRLMKERFKLKIIERAILQLPPLASPREVVATIRRYDQSLGVLAARELSRLVARLVVSQTRLRSDLELGTSMSAVAERFLGVQLDYLGNVDHDDAAWLTVRKRSPLLVDSPTSKSARNIERVARRILALLAAKATRGPDAQEDSASLRADAPLTLYDTLAVGRTAADDEIRRAYKRQREIFREGSFPVVSVVSSQALREEQSRIEEAYDTLLDANKRRAYDLATFPDDVPHSAPKRTATSAALAEQLLLQAEVAREVHPETEFTGALLTKVRLSQGVELSDIAQRTKISAAHLRAIEAEVLGDLPALVYVQGFVQEIAKYLRLDPQQVVRSYMRRMRDREADDVPKTSGRL
jgi:flagellar biosynthesis protein FlhG